MYDEDDVLSDEFAERMALWHLLYAPALVRTTDLAPLLVARWQHRSMWAAMRWVTHNTPELIEQPFEFFRAWRGRLCRTECARRWANGPHEFWVPGRCAAHHLWTMLEDARADEWKGVTVTHTGYMECALWHHAPGHSRESHTLAYWVDRLTLLADARSQIAYAQKLAEDAWHWWRAAPPKPEPPSDVVSVEELVS